MSYRTLTPNQNQAPNAGDTFARGTMGNLGQTQNKFGGGGYAPNQSSAQQIDASGSSHFEQPGARPITKGFNANSSTNILGRPGTGMNASVGPHNSRTKEEWQSMTGVRAMEESVAPEDRAAIYIDGLTDFLRKEYYRKLGVYINKSENEFSSLSKFWKDNVSLTYKKLREEKLLEKQIRRQAGSGIDDVMALTKAGQMRSSKQRGGAAPAAFQASENFIYNDYNKFGDQFEIDVFETIRKDIDQDNEQEKAYMLQSMQKQHNGVQNKLLKDDLDSMKRMLQIYCFGPALNNVLEQQYEEFKNGQTAPKVNKLYLGRDEPANRASLAPQSSKDPKNQGRPILKIWYHEDDEKEQKMIEEHLKKQQRLAEGGGSAPDATKTSPAKDKEQINTSNRPQSAIVKSLTQSLKKKVNKFATPTPPSKKKSIKSSAQLKVEMDQDEQHLAMHDYYDELLQYYTKLREVDPRTGADRQMRINNDIFFIDNEASFSEQSKTQYNSLLSLFQNNRRQNGTIIRDNRSSGGGAVGDFFSQENFIKRLCLHKFFISKSKIVNRSTLTQYYNSLNADEKARNFLDWDDEFDQKMKNKTRKERQEYRPTADDRPDACEILKLYQYKSTKQKADFDEVEHNRLLNKSIKKRRNLQEEVLHGKKAIEADKLNNETRTRTEIQEQEKNAGKSETQIKEEYYSKLAKPKDRWAVGHQLQELAEQFPHDRVLQRMLAEELKLNPIFRAPEEYDIYKMDEEAPKKIFKRKPGLSKPNDSYGEQMLQEFQRKDQSSTFEISRRATEKKKQAAFELALIVQATTYLEKVVDRRNPDAVEKALTVRNAVGEAHAALYRENFGQIIETRFGKSHLYGEIVVDEKSKTQRTNNVENMNNYSQGFKRYFFRIVKAIGDSKKGRTMGSKTIQRRIMTLPATFTVAGSSHTYNERVALNTTMMNKLKNKGGQVFQKSKVFQRADMKNALKKIFMTHEDAANCNFLPQGSKPSQDAKDDPNPIKTLEEKHGKNMVKTHPDVYKHGVFLQAKALFARGDYANCKMKICNEFHVGQLKHVANKITDVHMYETVVAVGTNAASSNFMQQQQEAEKEIRRGIDKSISAYSDNDKTMVQTDNPKGQLILQEVHDLLEKLEKREEDQRRSYKKLTKQREQLTNKADYLGTKNSISLKMEHITQKKAALAKAHKNAAEGLNEEIDQSAMYSLFKTIMCPLKDKCSRIQKIRWPYSNIKTIQRFGEQCPYAHHAMELEFPETLDARIKATNKAKKECGNRIGSDTVTKKAFIPASSLKCDTKMFPYYETKEMTGAKMKDVKNQKKSFVDKRQRALENDQSAYGQKLQEDSKTLAGFTTKLHDARSRTENAKALFDEEYEPGQKKEKYEMKGDENYVNKFGLLKRGCVLMSYGRYNDAFDALAEAVGIVIAQKGVEKERQEIVTERWMFKLGLEDNPFPSDFLESTHPDSWTDQKLAAWIKVNCSSAFPKGSVTQTARIFWEKISPLKLAEGSRDTFLNMQIENAYLKAKAELQDKKDVLKNMKKKISKLNELAQEMDEEDSDGDIAMDDMIDEDDLEGMKLKKKRRPTKLCKYLAAQLHPVQKTDSNGKKIESSHVKPMVYVCPDRKKYLDFKNCNLRKEDIDIKYPNGIPRDCPYGHGPMELDIIPTLKNRPSAEKANSKRLTIGLIRGDLGLKKDKDKEFEEPESNKANYFKKGADIRFHDNQFPAHKNIYEQTKDNLEVVQQKQDMAMRSNKPSKPFVPASQGGIEDLSVFAPYYPSETKGGEGEEADQNEKKPTSVFKLENPGVKPFEEDNA